MRQPTMENNPVVSRRYSLLYPMLLFIFLFLSPALSFAEPVILYTDILNGPNTGGENNNGIYLSIFGKGFGTTRGNSTVTINGVEVATYKQWGAPSRVYDSHGIQVITVQPGPAVSSGPIVVTVNGTQSNSNHTFTVRPGRIYFTDWNNGNDANDGTFGNPKKSAQGVFDTRAIFGPGDTIVLMGGTYTERQSGRSNYFMIFEDYPIGSEDNPTTVMGYPGHEIFIDMRGVSPNGEAYLFGTYTVPSQNAGLVLSNFHGHTGGASALRMRTTSYVRLVNTDIEGMQGSGNGTGMISSHGNFWKVLGNRIHNSGENRLYHAVYWSDQGRDNEIGWNHIFDIRGGRGIQTYDSGPGPFYNFEVHDNVIHNIDRDAMGFGGPSTTGFRIYNNIIYRTGLGTSPDGNGNSSGIRLGTGSLVAEIYNNTLFDNHSLAGALLLKSFQQVTIRNNTFYAATCYRDSGPSKPSGDPSGCTDSKGQFFYDGASNPGAITASNNIWYSSVQPQRQAVPSWDTSPIIADPLFVDSTSSARDFHLQSGSPAIDAGVNTFATRDFDGVVRPQASAFDLGAFEFCTGDCPPPPDLQPPAAPTALTVTQ